MTRKKLRKLHSKDDLLIPHGAKAAKAVYDGIRTAQSKHFETQDHSQSSEDQLTFSASKADFDDVMAKNHNNFVFASNTTREKAFKDGLLIDVSTIANSVGLHLPVGITKSLWERTIAASSDFSEKVHNVRTYDLLIAVRLRLATLDTRSQWIDVPVLLPFPPNPIPKFFSIFAIFYKDTVL